MPTIILVNPQMGENIGAAARIMANFGLSEMRLVAPRDGWPNESALAMSAGAFDEHVSVSVFDSLSDALGDIHYALGTTARRRDMIKPVFAPQAGMESLRKHENAQSEHGTQQNTAIVFGPERTGLVNDDLARLSGFITIDTNPAFSSLNLAQSIALMVYEYARDDAERGAPAPLDYGDSFAVSGEEFENYMQRFIGALDDHNFFKAEGVRESMIRNLYNLYTRADLSDQDVRSLHGVLSALTRKNQ